MERMMIADLEIEKIVEQAIHKTLLTFGIDTSTPEGVLEFQKDQHHLRSDRLRKEGMITSIWQHIITMLVSAGGGVLAASTLMH